MNFGQRGGLPKIESSERYPRLCRRLTPLFRSSRTRGGRNRACDCREHPSPSEFNALSYRGCVLTLRLRPRYVGGDVGFERISYSRFPLVSRPTLRSVVCDHVHGQLAAPDPLTTGCFRCRRVPRLLPRNLCRPHRQSSGSNGLDAKPAGLFLEFELPPARSWLDAVNGKDVSLSKGTIVVISNIRRGPGRGT